MNDEARMTNGAEMHDAGFLRDGMVMPQSAGYAGIVCRSATNSTLAGGGKAS
jgi:hypothetical protein